jgi:hypothetical protein
MHIYVYKFTYIYVIYTNTIGTPGFRYTPEVNHTKLELTDYILLRFTINPIQTHFGVWGMWMKLWLRFQYIQGSIPEMTPLIQATMRAKVHVGAKRRTPCILTDFHGFPQTLLEIISILFWNWPSPLSPKSSLPLWAQEEFVILSSSLVNLHAK